MYDILFCFTPLLSNLLLSINKIIMDLTSGFIGLLLKGEAQR
jgi:hypothetical protein